MCMQSMLFFLYRITSNCWCCGKGFDLMFIMRKCIVVHFHIVLLEFYSSTVAAFYHTFLGAIVWVQCWLCSGVFSLATSPLPSVRALQSRRHYDPAGSFLRCSGSVPLWAMQCPSAKEQGRKSLELCSPVCCCCRISFQRLAQKFQGFFFSVHPSCDFLLRHVCRTFTVVIWFWHWLLLDIAHFF